MKRLTRSGLAASLAICWALQVPAATGAGHETASEQAASGAAPAGFEDLMRRFAASGGVRARFVETRRLSLLEEPLESEGVLYFLPPDRLARHTILPERSSIVVRGNEVALGDPTDRKVIDLGSNDLARHIVDNLGAVLRGDQAALRSRYSLGYRSDGHEWVLLLEPRSSLVRRVVEWIRFDGRGDELSSMEIRETNGDSTATIFSEIETGLDATDRRLERAFDIDARDE